MYAKRSQRLSRDLLISDELESAEWECFFRRSPRQYSPLHDYVVDENELCGACYSHISILRASICKRLSHSFSNLDSHLVSIIFITKSALVRFYDRMWNCFRIAHGDSTNIVVLENEIFPSVRHIQIIQHMSLPQFTSKKNLDKNLISKSEVWLSFFKAMTSRSSVLLSLKITFDGK